MIKAHKDFSLIIKNSPFKKNKNFTIYYRPSQFNYSHFGIAVSKKLGNAVIRNKCKRRMRVILDKYKNELRTDFDYIIIMKENSSKISYEELEKSFQKLIKKEESK